MAKSYAKKKYGIMLSTLYICMTDGNKRALCTDPGHKSQ
jgi:hypothetical protein